ncbi:hypothetical protein DAEQUDRAFT_592048 [Daedalea quercina L-15889]|uniref:WD40 repeat-like protein n=1 Tax=Daedalea quercina L-15889 TaxID=1314783 RepID=A0A165SWF8_9APHY|nr:hypothetical protein DAEQUDRAFT_592048 [Daedalea quercina L-15889]
MSVARTKLRSSCWAISLDALTLPTGHTALCKRTFSADETVFACGGKSISAANISTLHAPKPVRVSDGRILQVHVHPQDTRVVILETDHLDNQVLVFDTRKGSFHCRPTLQFGHRDEHAPDIVRRFVKGSTLNSYFARPYTNSEMSVVRVWDYRKATAVVACFQEEHPAPIVHAVLSGSDLLAYGGHSVTIWKTSSGR